MKHRLNTIWALLFQQTFLFPSSHFHLSFFVLYRAHRRKEIRLYARAARLFLDKFLRIFKLFLFHISQIPRLVSAYAATRTTSLRCGQPLTPLGSMIYNTARSVVNTARFRSNSFNPQVWCHARLLHYWPVNWLPSCNSRRPDFHEQQLDYATDM